MLSAKLAYRNIPRRKARSTLTVVAVVLGVALLVGINMATASAMGEFTSYINRFWGQTDIVVRYGTPAPFDSEKVRLVRQVPEIRQTAERINWPASLDNTTLFQLIGVDPAQDFDYASLNITGASSLSPGQAVVTNTLAQSFGLSLGASFKVFTKNLALNNVTISLEVAGIDNPLRNIGTAVYVYLPHLQSALGLKDRITHIYATIEDPTRAIQVRDHVQSILGRLFDVSAPKAEVVQRIQGQMAGFRLGLNVMIIVALVVCSFIVFNTLFMTVNERTYEIGVMRAIGTFRRQIFTIFLGEGLLIGGIGTLTGILAGVGLSRLFTTIFEKNFGIPSIPEIALTAEIMATGLAAGLAAVTAGCLYPALSASRTDIIQAIRPKARNQQKRTQDPAIGLASTAMLAMGALQAFRLTPFHISYLDVVLIPVGLVLFGALVYRRAGQLITTPLLPLSRAVTYLASRSGRRRLVRNAVSFGMIAITLSFVIMLGGIQSGVQEALEQGVREALGADIILVANQSLPISFTGNLTSLPEVSAATPLGPSFLPTKAFSSKGEASIGVLAVDPSQFPRIIAYNFVNPQPVEDIYAQLDASNETLLLPDALASRLGVAAGDELALLIFNRTSVNQVDQVNFRVVGVFTGPILQYIRFGESFASESIIVSFKSQQRYFNGRLESPIFLVDLKPEHKPNAATVALDIAALYPRYNLAENSVTLDGLLALVRSTIDKVFAVILLILYFALLIATLGIGATMIMNVADRRREIGLLRSQGMSRGQILGLFLGEGIILGLFGFLLAVPGGLLLLKGATNSTTIAGFWLPFIIPWAAIGQSFLLATLAVVAGAFYPALRASKMEITKALEQV